MKWYITALHKSGGLMNLGGRSAPGEDSPALLWLRPLRHIRAYSRGLTPLEHVRDEREVVHAYPGAGVMRPILSDGH